MPAFITAPGETDVLMVVMAIVLALAVAGFGVLFLRIHSLPERLAHRGHKLQFEIVAVLCLIALFTHMHIFWVAALLLALIDLPDFGTPLNRIAGSAEKLAGLQPGEGATAMTDDTLASTGEAQTAIESSPAITAPDPNTATQGRGRRSSSTNPQIVART
jgi:hypothetical protein